MYTARLFNISGLVQGVGFRYFVVKEAEKLGITGYTKNLSDGSVEVFAMGEEEKILKLKEKLKSGPAYSKVKRIEEKSAVLNDKYKNFIVLY